MGQWVNTHIPELLISFGVVFMLISGLHWWLRWQALTLHTDFVDQYQKGQQDDRRTVPTHISIPWFVDTDIEPATIQGNVWTVAENSASYLTQSAHPGEQGNIIIYGHNKRGILGNIRALKGGEVVTITTENGDEYQYKVTNIIEVDPTNLQYLQPTLEETLTMYTCSGLLDKMRFIVQGKRVKE